MCLIKLMNYIGCQIISGSVYSRILLKHQILATERDLAWAGSPPPSFLETRYE